jgi:uncharacterized membrane protein
MMMMMRKVVIALAAVSLVTTPVLAQQARDTLQAPAPAAEQVDGSKLNGGFVIPLVLVVAGILAILAATHTWPFKRHHPVSP